MDADTLSRATTSDGDLYQGVAGLNFGVLHAQGAKPRHKDRWDASVEVLSKHTVLPKASIHPGTMILQKQHRSPRLHP